MNSRPRAVLAVLALLALYGVVIAMGDARAWSGSDAGGRVATVKWMADHHSFVPDVGYWAARYDPTGAHHPLYHTEIRGGHWVQPASLPYVVAGRLLWQAGGAKAILVLPVLGSVLAALAALVLARRCGARSGWGAFWLVGATGPALFYAGDFWEHSLALGAGLAALALLWSPDEGPDRPMRVAAAGALAGLAVMLRTEMAIYLAALAAATLLVPGERRRWLARWQRAVWTLPGLVAVPAVITLIERRLVGVGLPASRAGSSATQAGSHLALRVHDAAITTVGLLTDDAASALLLGGLAVAGFGALFWLARRDDEAEAPPSIRGLGLVGLLLTGARVVAGAGFVPGVLAATPLASGGALSALGADGEFGGGRDRRRVLVLTALLALPMVWIFQWSGQLLPQWGGRYALLSGALLTIAGAVALERVGWRQPTAAALVAVCVVIGALGAVWHVQRTRAFAGAIANIERTGPSTVVISRITHLGREGGAFYGDHRWLSARGPSGLDGAVSVASRAGAPGIEVVTLVVGPGTQAPVLAGFTHDADRRVPLLGLQLLVSTYARD